MPTMVYSLVYLPVYPPPCTTLGIPHTDCTPGPMSALDAVHGSMLLGSVRE